MKHGVMQADRLLENQVNILQLDPQAAGRESESLRVAGPSETTKLISSDIDVPTRLFILMSSR